MTTQLFADSFFLPGYNEFHSTPILFSRNVDDRGRASHTWRTQNAKKIKINTKRDKQSTAFRFHVMQKHLINLELSLNLCLPDKC